MRDKKEEMEGRGKVEGGVVEEWIFFWESWEVGKGRVGGLEGCVESGKWLEEVRK